MLKTLIQPQAPLAAHSAVSCITDGQASGSEWAGELSLRREDFSVCMCMCIYMKCVSMFLEGLACQKTQGRHSTHKRKTHTGTHNTANPLTVGALKEATM